MYRSSQHVVIKKLKRDRFLSEEKYGTDKIPLEEIESKYDKILGEGALAVVTEAIWRDEKIALKKLHDEYKERAYEERLMDEAILHASLDHPGIVKIWGMTEDSRAILLDLMPDNLFDRVGHYGRGFGAVPECRKIFHGVAKGIKYMHDHHVIHRDIKVDNILLDENGKPFIADFNLSVELPSGTIKFHEDDEKPRGSLHNIAPEIFRDANYDEKTDVYAFACLMYGASSCVSMFGNSQTVPNVKKRVLNGERGILKYLPEDCDPVIRQAIEEGWADPDLRPSADELVSLLEPEDEFRHTPTSKHSSKH